MMIRNGFELRFHPDEYGISLERHVWQTADISRYGSVVCESEEAAKNFAADLIRCAEAMTWPGTSPGRIPLVVDVFESAREGEGWCVVWDHPSDVFKQKTS